jgi:hypothetical protein
MQPHFVTVTEVLSHHRISQYVVFSYRYSCTIVKTVLSNDQWYVYLQIISIIMVDK